MVDLLPYRPEVTNRDSREPVVLDLASEHADRVFKALSSETGRRILGTLYEEPQVASDIADTLDMSLQNVDYHLKKLRDAELVEVVDTWYSNTGNEMKVYAPTAQALMVSSDPDQTNRLRSVASTLIASVIVLGVAAASFRFIVVEWLVSTSETYRDDSPSMAAEDPVTPADPLTLLPTALDPGVVFVLGGLVMLLAVSLIWLGRGHLWRP